MIQLEQQQHGEFWVGWWVGWVGNIPTTYIQLTLWLDQYISFFKETFGNYGSSLFYLHLNRIALKGGGSVKQFYIIFIDNFFLSNLKQI